ncbi:hypothetical protein FRC14_007817 [Serendipita sp. 396]|nr:hypothetical protein FRC14_007817 [Serendipita sp. 396]
MRFTSFVSLLIVATTFAAAAPVPTGKNGHESELEKPTTHDLTETRATEVTTTTDDHHPRLVPRSPEKTREEHEADAAAHTLLGMRAQGQAQTLRGEARQSNAARTRALRAMNALPEGHVDKDRLREEANGHQRDHRAKTREADAKDAEAQGHFGRATASRTAAANAPN